MDIIKLLKYMSSKITYTLNNFIINVKEYIFPLGKAFIDLLNTYKDRRSDIFPCTW